MVGEGKPGEHGTGGGGAFVPLAEGTLGNHLVPCTVLIPVTLKLIPTPQKVMCPRKRV